MLSPVTEDIKILSSVFLIFAPNKFKKLIKSVTSGSIEQLLNVVSLSANIDAIIAFSEPVTLLVLNLYNPPVLDILFVSKYPLSIIVVYPSDSKALICSSIGLSPIAQPPGKEIRALPKRPRRAPQTNTDALIVFTNS